MKVLDVHGLHGAIDEIINELNRKNDQMKNIRHSIQQFISLEDSLKGKAGKAIREYFEDVHITFLTYWEMFSEEFEAVLKQIKMELQSLEPVYNGFLRQSFLTNELEHGLQNIKNVTAKLTDDANLIIDRVQDIVSLPRIHDDYVQHHVKEAQDFRDNAIEHLWDFDHQQTAALNPIQEMIGNMYLFVQQAKSYFELNNHSIITYIRPIDRKTNDTEVGEPASEKDHSLYSSIMTLKSTVDFAKKGKTLIKGRETSYVLYKAGKNNDLRAVLEKGPNGKKYYRIVATRKGFEILGIDPDTEAARELNRGLPKNGKKWTDQHILKAETNTAILKYNTKKPNSSGWSNAGEAAIEKYPEIQYLTHKDASRIDKAKIVGKATLKGAANSLKEAVDLKSIVKSGGFLKGAGKALGPIGAGLSYYSNLEDAKKDKLSGDKAVVRAVQDTAIDTAVGGAVQAAFTAGLTVIIPIPGVGTAIGVVAGVVANTLLTTKLGKDNKSVMDRIKSWFH